MLINVGDKVTPENVGHLPVGAIVRWPGWDEVGAPELRAAIRQGPDEWHVTCSERQDGWTATDASISTSSEDGPDKCDTFVAYLPEVTTC